MDGFVVKKWDTWSVPNAGNPNKKQSVGEYGGKSGEGVFLSCPMATARAVVATLKKEDYPSLGPWRPVRVHPTQITLFEISTGNFEIAVRNIKELLCGEAGRPWLVK